MPRLFFALVPNADVRAQLAERARDVAIDYSGRRMRADTLHLTMLFIGDAPELLVPDLLACGDRVNASSFTLEIDARSHFNHAKVAWLGCTEPPAALHELWMALRAQVDPVCADYPVREYSPHITVARNCLHYPPPRGIETVQWRVEDFVLIDSTLLPGGPMHRVLRHWQLED